MFARRIIFWVLTIGLVCLLDVSTSQASLLIWYDAEKQAIGVNPYADGWGFPDIAIDFDSDHSSAGIIRQNTWVWGDGFWTTVCVYRYKQDDSGGRGVNYYYDSTGTGFCENYPAVDASLFVTGAAAYGGDMIRYFVDEWNVAESKTTIYIQPTNASHAIIPVLESDLLNARYALGDALRIAPDAASWSPIPEPASAVIMVLGATLIASKRRRQ
jgi:hypothetical protein